VQRILLKEKGALQGDKILKVSEEVSFTKNSKIQFAIPEKGGESSWGKEASIRLAWYNDNKFDPYSSSELPLWALVKLVEEGSKRDLFNKSEIAVMIENLKASHYRQQN